MALVIEDGTIVPGAESYVSAAELKAYAAKRGITVPADDSACEVLLIKAMDYLNGYEPRWKGCRVSAEQPLAWPRKGVRANGFPLPSNTIPGPLKAGQCVLAVAAQTLELMPTVDPAQSGVKRDKTGPLETEFFGPNDGVYSQPVITAADTAMAVLLQSGAFTLTVDRA